MFNTYRKGPVHLTTVPYARRVRVVRAIRPSRPSHRRALIAVGLALIAALALMLPFRSHAQAAAPYLGTPPREGEVALIMTSEAVTPPLLAGALTAERCAPEVIAITVDGQWLIYVPNAPAFVNERFPASLAQWTGFFVRCR